MTERYDAKRRDISRRLAICSEGEVDVIDLVLLHVERSRDARIDHCGPLFDTGSDYSELENAYRRGHNDAMRAETPQVTLWRTRLLLATRSEEIERGLAELRRNATERKKLRIECDQCHAEWAPEHMCMSGVVGWDLSEVE